MNESINNFTVSIHSKLINIPIVLNHVHSYVCTNIKASSTQAASE